MTWSDHRFLFNLTLAYGKTPLEYPGIYAVLLRRSEHQILKFETNRKDRNANDQNNTPADLYNHRPYLPLTPGVDAVSDFFPRNTLAATILHAFLYFVFRVFRQVNDLNMAQIISPENGWTNIQTGLTVVAFTDVNNRNLHRSRYTSLFQWNMLSSALSILSSSMVHGVVERW